MARPPFEQRQKIYVHLTQEDAEILTFIREHTGAHNASEMLRAALRAYRRELSRGAAAPASTGT